MVTFVQGVTTAQKVPLNPRLVRRVTLVQAKVFLKPLNVSNVPQELTVMTLESLLVNHAEALQGLRSALRAASALA